MIDLRTILIAPDSAKSDILNNVGISQSPFTGGLQVTELPGARWKLTFSYENLPGNYSRTFKAIKAQLRGGAEVAHVYDYSYIPRRTVEPGRPVINGANQEGIVVLTSGWTPNIEIIKYGDQLSYLSTDGMYRMHVATADVTSDARGNATIPILPPLRNPPVDATAVSTVAPVVSVQLTSGGEVSINGVVVSASLELTEALYGIS